MAERIVTLPELHGAHLERELGQAFDLRQQAAQLEQQADAIAFGALRLVLGNLGEEVGEGETCRVAPPKRAGDPFRVKISTPRPAGSYAVLDSGAAGGEAESTEDESSDSVSEPGLGSA